MGQSLGNQSYAWWVGQDGNLWANIGGVGVTNLGAPVAWDGDSPVIMSYADQNMPSDYLDPSKRISDPAGSSTNEGNTTSVSSSSAPAPVLNTGAIAATNQAIDALGTQQRVGEKNIEDSYGSLLGGYDREKTRNESDYNESTVTNTTNLQKNKQNALVSAAQGRRGLRGVLASIGALFGTGGKLADRAVTTEANQDIGEATDTAASNAQQLDKAIGRFREEDENRRVEAGTAKTNQRTRLEGDIASDRQKLYKSMADIYKEGGDLAAADSWLRKAGDLNEFIAQRTAVAQTPFSQMAAMYTPGQLADYLAGAGDMTVEVAPAGGETGVTAPSILAGRRKKTRRELLPAAA